MSGTPEVLDHSFKSKAMLNTTAALLIKIMVYVVTTMLENLYEMFYNKLDIRPIKQSELAKHLKYFPDHQFEWNVLTRAPE